jgi:signal peptidase I
MPLQLRGCAKEHSEAMSTSPDTKRSGLGDWRETLKTIAYALAIALVVRTLFYQPFNIPSGSMKPTLLVGDYLFASKFAYGYSRYSLPFGLLPFDRRLFGVQPKRGDVVIFKLPRDNATDYVKRVIGLPGDAILVRDAVVYINGQVVPQAPAGFYVGPEVGRPKPRFEETLPNGVKHYVLHWPQQAELDNAGPFKVPEGHYFMMGDNRDDSIDSRVSSRYGVGYVPYENLIGRAAIVFFSMAIDDPHAFRLTSPWTWPFDVRWARIFTLPR